MRKLRIFEHISLDGVIQQSADENDFPYSDWSAPYRTPAGREILLAMYGESFDLLIGRRTHDLLSGFWPKAPKSPMAEPTGLRAWNGARSRALDRTSSRTFAASSRTTALT
jgi:hypothetical protein